MRSNDRDIYYSEIFDIPVNMIVSNPNSPRRYFDSLKMKSLTKSIEEYGVIQPLTVREYGDMFEIVSGERRLRAAARAGLEYVPAFIIKADDGKSAVMTLLENLQREDLCFFEIAESYKNLLRKQGLTQSELADRIGLSRSCIANKIRLLRLPIRVRRLIRDYGLSERHARAILALPDEEMQLLITKQIHTDKLSASDSEKLIDRKLNDIKKSDFPI